MKDCDRMLVRGTEAFLNGIFVYGCNETNSIPTVHSKYAFEEFGAMTGKLGLNGNSYALSIVDSENKLLPFQVLLKNFMEFAKVAWKYQNYKFYIADFAILYPYIYPDSFADVFHWLSFQNLDNVYIYNKYNESLNELIGKKIDKRKRKFWKWRATVEEFKKQNPDMYDVHGRYRKRKNRKRVERTWY